MNFVEYTRKVLKEEVIPEYWEAAGRRVRFMLSDNGRDSVYLKQLGKKYAYVWHRNPYDEYISPKKFRVRGMVLRNRRILRNLEILK